MLDIQNDGMNGIQDLMKWFLNYDTWGGSKGYVERNQDLFSDEGLRFLEELIRQAEKDGNQENLKRLLEHHNVLTSCRNNGILAAFEGKKKPDFQVYELDGIKYLQGYNPYKKLADKSPTPRGEQIVSSIRDLFDTTSIGIKKFIEKCKESLKLLPFHDDPISSTRIEVWLGVGLLELAKTDGSVNVKQALNYFHDALKLISLKNYPKEWAKINVLVASALLKIKDSRAQNVEKAISHCLQSCQVFTEIEYPNKWATIQGLLCEAYIERVYQEKADNLEKAIFFGERAMNILYQQKDQEKWISNMINLGVAYRQRPLGLKRHNHLKAIQFFDAGLKYCIQGQEQWARIHFCKGDLFHDQIVDGSIDRLNQALLHYKKALKFYSKKRFPHEWASVQHNLGSLYINLIDRSPKKYLNLAIKYFGKALKIRGLDKGHEFWARTQCGIGAAYSTFLDKVQAPTEAILKIECSLFHTGTISKYFRTNAKSTLVSKAISHSKNALGVYSLRDYPVANWITNRNIGDIYFENEDWGEAVVAYQNAISAAEYIYQFAFTEGGRRIEVAKISQLYTRLAYCYIQLNRFNDAFVQLESGKTRLLSEALALDNIKMDHLGPNQQDFLINLRRDVQNLEQDMRFDNFPLSDATYKILSEQLLAAKTLLNGIIDLHGKAEPNFILESLTISEILALVPKDHTIIATIITSKGSAAILVPHGTKELSKKNIVNSEELRFTFKDLNKLLYGSAQDIGWIPAYNAFRKKETQSFRQWENSIKNITGELWKKLLQPIHDRLSKLQATKLIMIVQGGCQLLPLHAAWRLENNEERYFLEDHEISYAPSVITLAHCHPNKSDQQEQSALIVGIGEYLKFNNLEYSTSEAKIIANMLSTVPILNASAAKELVIQEAHKHTVLHLSCHGMFGWENDPFKSSLILAEDQHMTLSEIMSLDLRKTKLVTLSACETGVIETKVSPDEFIGLQTGFIQAGAKAVVSSLWMVEEKSTKYLMMRFYHNLNEGLSFSQALTEAQKWILRTATWEELGHFLKSYFSKSNDLREDYLDICWKENPEEKPFSHPYFWAPFIYTGL